MPRIYLSPSTQQGNIGIAPFTNEEREMNKIVDILVPLLIKDGRFIVKRNGPSMDDVYSIATDSNNFKADIHVAIHSNAGGGKGTEVFAFGPNTDSERLCKALYNQIAPLSPGADRGVKYNPKLIEVGNSVNATSAYIELGFHDNTTDAAWLANSQQSIANALYKGICDYYGYDYRALVVVPPVTPAVMYRVILDGKQVMAIASQDKAVTEVKKAVDSGQAIKGTVQRNTDGVNVFEYVKPVAPVMDKDDQAIDHMKQAIKILEG